MIFRAPARFLQLYLLRGGILDGIPGLQICAYTSFYVFMKQARLWELHYAKAQPDPEAERTAGVPRLIRFTEPESAADAAASAGQTSTRRAA